MIFVIGTLGLICVMLAWMLHGAWGELEEAYKELDFKDALISDLKTSITKERRKSRQIEALWSAEQLGK